MCPGLQPLHVCDLLVGQRAVGPVRRKGPFGRRRRRQVVNAAMTDRAVPSPHAPSVAPRGPARRTSTRADDHSIAELGFPTNAMGNTSAVAPAAISAVPVDCTSAIDLGSALSSSLPNCRDARPDGNRLDQCRACPRYHSCGGDVGQFDRWRFLFEAATGQLRWAGKLLQTRASDDMRAPMLDYDDGRPVLPVCLAVCRSQQILARTATTLAEMARKETYIGNLDNALTLIEFAQVPADRVPTTGRAMLWTAGTIAGLDRATGRSAGRGRPGRPPLCQSRPAERSALVGLLLTKPSIRAVHRATGHR
jgi:hypothetical protein